MRRKKATCRELAPRAGYVNKLALERVDSLYCLMDVVLIQIINKRRLKMSLTSSSQTTDEGERSYETAEAMLTVRLL